MATFATFDDRRASAAPARRMRVGVDLVGVAHAHEHRRLGAELTAGGDGERLAPLALEADFGHEREQGAAERTVDDVGTGAELSGR